MFANDRRAIHRINESAIDLKRLTPFQRALYDDFAIRRDGELGCPENFNLLSVGWYVNEPAAGHAPNLYASETYDLIAARDIAEGEELTVTYSTFSEAEAC